MSIEVEVMENQHMRQIRIKSFGAERCELCNEWIARTEELIVDLIVALIVLSLCGEVESPGPPSFISLIRNGRRRESQSTYER